MGGNSQNADQHDGRVLIGAGRGTRPNGEQEDLQDELGDQLAKKDHSNKVRKTKYIRWLEEKLNWR